MATFDFSGKVAIITGASSGIGEATSILFAQSGASVVLCGRDEKRLKATFDQCVEASGGHDERLLFLSGDLTESSVRKSIIEKTIQSFGKLDILVANAGAVFPGEDIFKATEEAFDFVFDTNVKSTFFLIQTALPYLEKCKGNIICVSSLASTFVYGNSALYPMSKAAIDHMTRCLALDLAPKGIRVNAVCPGYIPTRMFRSFDYGMDVMNQVVGGMEYSLQPLSSANHSNGCVDNGTVGSGTIGSGTIGSGTIGSGTVDNSNSAGGGDSKAISPKDVANNVAFLAWEGSRFVTGQCHILDGGRRFMGAGQYENGDT